MNNQGKTSIFVGMNENKVLNEIAFARFNLKYYNFIIADPGKSSNTWVGKSSSGFDIHMYIGSQYISPLSPSITPSLNTNYNSAFPKL